MSVIRWRKLFFLLCLVTVIFLVLWNKLVVHTHSSITRPTTMALQQNTYVQSIRDETKAIQQYYKAIEDARRKTRLSTGRTRSCEDNSELMIRASELHYFNKFISAIPNAETVFLETTIADISQFLRTTHFPPTSNDCLTLERKAVNPDDYTNKIGCTSSLVGQAFKLAWSEMVDFPFNNINIGSEGKNVTFLHLIPNALIDKRGDVVSNKAKVILHNCRLQRDVTIFGMLFSWIGNMFSNFPTEYDEVFSIANEWGDELQHYTMEALPRLMLYLPFLHDNPKIKILADIKHPFLPLLGLAQSRIISGTVRAKTLYLPAASKCKVLPLLGGQLLSSALQEAVKKRKLARNLFVFIKSTHSTSFRHHDEIYSMLNRYAQQLDLDVVTFDDNVTTDIHSAIEIFHRALAVVSLRGSGEANILFSQPVTLFIQALCFDRGHIDLSYQTAAKVLGLRYHGIVFNKKSCFDITANDVEQPLIQHLKLLEKFNKIK